MRWIFRLLGIVLVLVVFAVGALFLIPTDRIAGIAAQQFTAATGRALSIRGGVRPTIYPTVGVRLGDVELANMQGTDTGPMVLAGSIAVGLDVAALVAGNIVIRNLDITDARVILERGMDGVANWSFAPGAEPVTDIVTTEGAQASQGLVLDRAQISNASLRLIDRQTGTDLTLEGLDATLTLPAWQGPASLSASAVMRGQPLSLDAQIDGFGAFADGRVAPVSLSGQAAGATFAFDGRAGTGTLSADGQLSLDVPDLGPVLALLGQAAVAPQGVAPLSLAGQVTLAPAGSLHLRDGQIGVAGNRLTGAADVTFDGQRPMLSAQLAAGELDLTALTSGAGGGAGGGAAAAGWPTTPIDASALGLADAALVLSASSLRTGAFDLGPLRVAMTLDRSRAVFDLREVRLFDGLITGEFVMNNRAGLSVGGNLAARDIALLPLLRDMADFDRLNGTGAAELQFLGSGASVDAIMKSLSGSGNLGFDRGEIIGFDLAGMLRNLDMSYMGEGNRTIYQSITGSFTMNDGVLRNDDLSLDADRVTVTGAGSVGLGERVLDYRLTPVALVDRDTGQSLRVPLLVTGPWSAPRLRLDLEGLAEERLREERERLEERAREELRTRAEAELQRSLQIERAEGESLEDAARRRLEEEVGRGLQRLLGGN
ncbi:AsmA family protein [Roseicitreum antarcticum]|uniref:AsmA protein n=1 Tax=Roseicitreum antarcticum TaxID=564137 RepID=A0A1H2SJM8_9RHOB|nr:AsmA family protein [Roseicitreum antarcticum]SDW31728.1 AsmA protein [Roseicitreum antarcticum]